MLNLTDCEIEDVAGGGDLLKWRHALLFTSLLMSFNYENLKIYQAINKSNKNNWEESILNITYGLAEDACNFTLIFMGMRKFANEIVSGLLFKAFRLFAHLKGD